MIISLITTLGIVCGLITLCAARFCNKPCNGCWTKWYVTCSALVFLAISIIFFLVGSVLVVIQDQFNEEFILRECENAVAKRDGDANIKLGVTSVDIQEFFQDVVEIDKKYESTINKFMCTDFCICPGLPTSEWVLEYNAKPDDYYTEFNRAKTGYDGKIDIARFQDGNTEAWPLFWNWDVTDPTKVEPEFADITSKSFFECIDNMDDLLTKYVEGQKTVAG